MMRKRILRGHSSNKGARSIKLLAQIYSAWYLIQFYNRGSKIILSAIHTRITLKPGDVFEMTFFTPYDYQVFTAGNTSKMTRIAATGKSGNNKATIYIGADEQSTGVDFWFYLYDTEDHRDSIQVVIEQPALIPAAVPGAVPAAVPVPAFKVSTVYDSKVGYLTGSAGNAIATFAVSGKNGAETIVPGGVINNGIGNYIIVSTPSDPYAAAAAILPQDKAAAKALGITGIIVNGNVTNW